MSELYENTIDTVIIIFGIVDVFTLGFIVGYLVKEIKSDFF